jgi:hypothetical protein
LGFRCVALFNIHTFLDLFDAEDAKKKYKRGIGIPLLCVTLRLPPGLEYLLLFSV